MNEHLRDRILRKLESLSDERGYQVLDFVEYLESRYAERQSPQNAFTRFTEAVEDRLRAGRVSANTIAEAMGLMNRAAGMLNTAVAAGRSVANELVSAPGAPSAASAPRVAESSTIGGTSTPAASNVAGTTQMPGSGEEKL